MVLIDAILDKQFEAINSYSNAALERNDEQKTNDSDFDKANEKQTENDEQKTVDSDFNNANEQPTENDEQITVSTNAAITATLALLVHVIFESI